MSTPYDLVVIGGGSAGLTAARLAADLGAHVALIERDRLGGDCLWTGCVPSKTLLHAAAQVHAARRAHRYGLTAATGPADWTAVAVRVREAIGRIEPHDSPEALTRLGVEVIRGEARFTGPRTLDADGRIMAFRHALVATGSSPHLPAVPGLAEAGALTSDTVWDLPELPRRLLVIGGGAVGCELGQAFARLGSQVTVVEAEQRLLPTTEPQAADLLQRRLAAEGVTVHTGAVLRSVRPDTADLTTADHTEHTLAFDQVLVATGRRPHLAALGLEAGGIRTTDRGFIATDARLRTSNPRVFAAGDVTGRLPFTHVAGVQAGDAVLNALLGLRRHLDYDAMPYAVFTDPEIAQVGLTAARARDRYGDAARTRLLPHEEMDRAVTENATDGFTQLVLGPKGRIVGATVVGPRAGEAIVELAHAVRLKWSPGRLAATVHPYPTHADGPWLAALAKARRNLSTPRTRALTSALLGLRRGVLR
ncbi:dihydrolipoyl dehydrogenase family protein [Streptomyces rubellomurinus]|uniref:Oxidoreductase n=1 Tax=Streptomyces rubellomurinus (strain ATCC 31215) TaxID=359131 RepID=A0A0F2TJL0_STRR3|nr:NAD(P)/FAD-dependent oxidoreductase [Streptomyces rubellomurinus]KJS63344.1 oxidoreductase [Streptomyces rubellomurinus]